MADVTLAQAQELLDAYRRAALKIAERGQSYTIDTPNGQRTLTRADLGKVQDQIKYWSGEVRRLETEAAGSSGRVIYAGRVS